MMEDSQRASYLELVTKHKRDINCLNDEDKNTRKRGIIKLNRELFKSEVDKEDYFEFYSKELKKPLLRTVEDQVEKCRELSLEIITKFVENLGDKMKEEVNFIIPVLLSRINNIPYPEESEELRLQIVQILRTLVKKFPNELLPFLSDSFVAFSKAALDAFPDVKKETAAVLIELCQQYPNKVEAYCKPIILPLLKNLSHQHSRVRRAHMETIQQLLLCAPRFIEDFLPKLKDLQEDRSQDVRKLYFNSLKVLLLHIDYTWVKTYESSLLLHLMSGLSDDSEDIEKDTITALDEVGLRRKELAIKYEEEMDD